MVLNISRGLFGKNSFLEGNIFSGRAQELSLIVFTPGTSVAGTLNLETSQLAGRIAILGFEISIGAFNMLVADRDIILTLQNFTKSTTLDTVSVTLEQGASITKPYFFSLEQIDSGDEIRLVLGGDGLGTVLGASVQGYLYLQVSTVYEQNDEKQI